MCKGGGDIREFLANLCYKKEELVAAGVHITDKVSKSPDANPMIK